MTEVETSGAVAVATTEVLVAEEATETEVPDGVADVFWAETAATAERRARMIALSQSMAAVELSNEGGYWEIDD